MTRYIYFAFILLLCQSCLFSQEIIVDPNASFNGECALVVNPKDEQNLIVAWMQLNDFVNLTVAIAVSYSHDGGITWSEPQFMPHAFQNRTSADPTLAFNKDGACFLAYIDYKFTRDSGFVYITQTLNNGETWSAPSVVIDIFDTPDKAIDRPWLAIDESDGPYKNRIYLTTKNLKEAALPHHIWLVYSDDGVVFSDPKIVDFEIEVSLLLNTMGVPAVTSDGKLFIAYLSYDLSASFYPQLIFAQSNDGGVTLSNNEILEFSGESAFEETDTLYQFSYSLSANPLDASNLILIFTDNRNGDPDIYAISTQDGGITWTSPMRINDDVISNDVGQDMCWGSFNKNGVYVCAWRDRREGGEGQEAPYKIYASTSSNLGILFTENLTLSSENSPLFEPVDGNDFLGVAANNECIFSTWEDYRNNVNNQLYFNKECILLNSLPSTTLITEEILLYPNPAERFISIEISLTAAAIFEFEIVNMQGERIIHEESKELQIGKNRIQILIPENSAFGNYQCIIKYEGFVRSIQFTYNR